MAKASRTTPRSNEILPGGNELTERSTLMDLIDDSQETTLDTLNQKPKETKEDAPPQGTTPAKLQEPEVYIPPVLPDEAPANLTPNMKDVMNEGPPQLMDTVITADKRTAAFVNEHRFVAREEQLTVGEQLAPKAPTRQVVVIKMIKQAGFRLGLENTPEKYVVMPGTTQRWAPKKVGNLHRTGLDRVELAPTPAERAKRIAELEYHFGTKLDHEFYANMSFKIDCNKPLGEKLYLDRPEDLVVYLAMLESDDVANGLHEYKQGKKPLATYYLEDKEAEAEMDAQERTDKIKALTFFQEISYAKKRKVATVLGLDVFGLSDKAAENVLWKWLEHKDNATKNCRLFVQIVQRGDTFINVSEMVKQAVTFNILRKTGTGDIFYGDHMVGASEGEIVEKLMSTKYSDLRLGIQTKVEAKLNTI